MVKKKIQIFDPPMCCSTGLCGPSIDPQLVQFATDLDFLRLNGVEVERYNLSQQPGMFTNTPLVMQAIMSDEKCLPLIIVDGAIVSKGKYVSRDLLTKYIGLEQTKEAPRERSWIHAKKGGCC